MAAFGDLECALNDVLLAPASFSDYLFCGKIEQEEEIRQLVFLDLLAVFPTGFGKSLIFQLLLRVWEAITKKSSFCSLAS